MRIISYTTLYVIIITLVYRPTQKDMVGLKGHPPPLSTMTIWSSIRSTLNDDRCRLKGNTIPNATRSAKFKNNFQLCLNKMRKLTLVMFNLKNLGKIHWREPSPKGF